jgi:hypothetical protein
VDTALIDSGAGNARGLQDLETGRLGGVARKWTEQLIVFEGR